ncbi:two-component sensor histidine kinase [Undibacterium sp. CY18W]|uniref:histidine kinase n=1 Tax=Undibacterium hunanense TaxID=2762292 RepID=A0ABR6ZUX1_9BURK|nr:ATP-binding protein [Undibacterium hunanense]MBC3919676.1 two-component sensor histidine kinase [Undibacterium hunanense]
MNRLFLRFVILVMLSISVATIAVYVVIRSFFGDPLEEVAQQQAAGQVFLLTQYVDQAGPDEWLVRLNKIREITHSKLELIPLQSALQQVATEKKPQFMRGEVVIDIAGKSFYRRVDLQGLRYIGSDEEVLHAQELPIDVIPVIRTEVVRYIIVALCLLIPIAIWSSSHWRGLQALEKVADEFGEGHLKIRAQTRESDSIYPLAQRMNQMAARIEGLLDAQKSLLHSVSHELRTPIARLEFGLELLRNAAKDPKLETRAAAMEADLLELNSLVTELLSLSKLDQQPALKLAEFVVADCLETCLDSLQHELSGFQVDTLFSDAVGSMIADQHLLARAVSNLLRNAGKYASQHISLTLKKAAGDIIIMLDDDGPGIPVEEREQIFNAFYRLDRSRDRATGGFGLGLAITQKAIQAHGGRITVEDSPLGGARFVLSLPATPQAAVIAT